ncbi:MAG TPA: sigma-54 dependent transcriptional regulator, partial [Planctomycetota bacterium]|nr:sigma-54 dependent transcriptional regulator [Planctomycetota bacterium]
MSGSPVGVLVIDDDAAHAESLGEALASFGYVPRVVHSGREGLAALAGEDFDLVLTDLRMADVDGMAVLEAARRKGDVEVVMITGHGSVESAVEAMRAGAAHYVTKPVNVAELKEVLARIVERQQLRRRNVELEAQLDERYGYASIIGRSEPMQAVFRTLRQVAPTDVTVLITGESGTGKELVARALHQNSRRRKAPFIALNCAALPESLLESELFGHEKGSFTGATARKIGHIENAQGGTLFLDEVGDMPLLTQAKLLRVLETREVQPVGGNTPRKIDVRLVAATNRDLRVMVKEGTFREDLLFRLQVVVIELPALRERTGDVPMLIDHFLGELARAHKRDVRGVTPEARTALVRYAWPGNVRELRNVIENMVLLARGDVLSLDDVP